MDSCSEGEGEGIGGGAKEHKHKLGSKTYQTNTNNERIISERGANEMMKEL